MPRIAKDVARNNSRRREPGSFRGSSLVMRLFTMEKWRVPYTERKLAAIFAFRRVSLGEDVTCTRLPANTCARIGLSHSSRNRTGDLQTQEFWPPGARALSQRLAYCPGPLLYRSDPVRL